MFSIHIYCAFYIILFVGQIITTIKGYFNAKINSSFAKLLSNNEFELIFKKYSIDKKVVNLLNTCLNRWSGTADSTTPGVGIPQGPQASFFLANLYLTEIDSILVNKDNSLNFLN